MEVELIEIRQFLERRNIRCASDVRTAGTTRGVDPNCCARDGCASVRLVTRRCAAVLRERSRRCPLPVHHFHGGRNAYRQGQNVLSTGPGNAIAGRSFFYDQSDLEANIWIMPPASRP